MAVSAAIENLSNIQPVNKTAIPNNDKSLLVDETNDAKSEQLASVINKSIPEATTTMEKNIESKTLSLLLPTEGDNGDNGDADTPPTTVLDQITENAATSDGNLEQNGGLLGVTVPSNVVPPGPILSLNIGDTITDEPMDVDINNEQNDTLHGVTATGNVVTKQLHGVTDLNSLDHSYSRQTNDSLTANYDYYATMEDEDNVIKGLLQLSATDNLRADFPGDNSQLLPIGARIPDTVPTDITVETAAVTAAIENITLEETVNKTTNTVSTQTTFTRQRHNRPAELSDLDTEDEVSKRPHTRSQAKSEENTRSTKKAKFKTIKYEIKKRRSSRTYACKECGKWKRDLKELNKHYKRKHKPVICGICNQLFSLPSTLDKHMYMHLNKSFTCEMCGMQFSFLSQLEYHKTVHKTIASYVCVYPKCKKSFMQKGDLTLHAQIHDKLTWKCNDCKWTTTCQKYLKAHIDGHFEELKYSCNLCEKRFKWRQQLK